MIDLSFLNSQLKDESILIQNNILFILDKIHNNRGYINKHFQNSINNYFLRKLCSPLLSNEMQYMALEKNINESIRLKYTNNEGARYLRLMRGYLQEIILQNKLEQYRQILVNKIIHRSAPVNRTIPKIVEFQEDLKISSSLQANEWKRAFALFLLFHSFNQNIQGIFEIWNALFPLEIIARKRKQNTNHVIYIPQKSSPHRIPQQFIVIQNLIYQKCIVHPLSSHFLVNIWQLFYWTTFLNNTIKFQYKNIGLYFNRIINQPLSEINDQPLNSQNNMTYQDMPTTKLQTREDSLERHPNIVSNQPQIPQVNVSAKQQNKKRKSNKTKLCHCPISQKDEKIMKKCKLTTYIQTAKEITEQCTHLDNSSHLNRCIAREIPQNYQSQFFPQQDNYLLLTKYYKGIELTVSSTIISSSNVSNCSITSNCQIE